MKLDLSTMGFGITGTVEHDVVRELAPRIEDAGFRTLWINHAGSGDALASMQVAASVTTRLRLASGVIPVDRMPAEEIVRSVQERALPLDRIVLGIGASAPPSPLSTLDQAVSHIRERLAVPIMIGALGPKMRRFGVQETNGVLLNWLTPDGARAAIADKQRDLADSPDSDAEVALYIRVALGEAARPVLEREASRYEGIPSYAANFTRLGFRAIGSAVYGESGEAIREGLEPYTGLVDEPVVRAITPDDSLASFLALVDAVSN
jgi:alkanesulfonate monooxygenase SsuD/methylene tetrahydromethanopterin reductase-like flavin-dependent oxidoreductase (luciferase family)